MTWEFSFANGQSGVKTVSSELIDNETIAKQRAIAEFMNGGVKRKYITFKTYHTDIKVGNLIQLEGLTYKVISVTINLHGAVIMSTVKGVHYVT